MKTKIVASAIVAVAGFVSLVANAAQELRVGTHPTFAPFEFMDTHTREYVGFDMDLIREMGKRAGFDVKLVNMGFDGLIPALFTGTIDVAASGITITEERKKKVDFCDPYYEAGQGLLVRTDSVKQYSDLKSLEGKTIAVQIGTTGADLAKTIKGANIKAFNTGAEAFMDLKMKGSEAVITDRPVIGYFMVKNPKAAKGLTMQKIRLDAEYFGIAVKKGNTALRNSLNDALRGMKSDGSYQKIYKKWFGE